MPTSTLAETPQPKTATAKHGFVTDVPAADPAEALRHFNARLAFETDCIDVKLDLERGRDDIIVVDVRAAADYAERHVKGAINIPTRTITAESTAHLPKDKTIVTYCWSPGCNGSTRAAARFAALGFKVKEMIGGLDYWMREENPVEGSALDTPFTLAGK